MVVPLGRARGVFDGAGEAIEADGESAPVACGADDDGEEPSGMAEWSELAGFDVDEVPHPARSKQMRKTMARTLQVCADGSGSGRGRGGSGSHLVALLAVRGRG
jgi:hypothetical protein